MKLSSPLEYIKGTKRKNRIVLTIASTIPVGNKKKTTLVFLFIRSQEAFCSFFHIPYIADQCSIFKIITCSQWPCYRVVVLAHEHLLQIEPNRELQIEPNRELQIEPNCTKLCGNASVPPRCC